MKAHYDCGGLPLTLATLEADTGASAALDGVRPEAVARADRHHEALLEPRKEPRTAREKGIKPNPKPPGRPLHKRKKQASASQVTVRRARGLAVCMAEVAAEEVQWLWHPYIPYGKLTSIEGDPGVGKSWLTMALAAQVSRGVKLPGVKHAVEPASVLLLTAEDGAADTVRPRLDAAGADVGKVHLITGPLSFDKAGAATLKREIEAAGPALVIIDPIVAYLPERTDMNSASAVRPVLARLAKVAEETGLRPPPRKGNPRQGDIPRTGVD